MRKYAALINNLVTEIVELDENEQEQYREKAKSCQLLIDITDETPQPVPGYVLNGNKLELPKGFSDREAFEEFLADKKTEFGIKLARTCVNKIGARNKILNKTGSQVTSILTTLMPIKALMETGALGTARYNCVLLKAVYTEYADIFDYVVNEINVFELSNTL